MVKPVIVSESVDKQEVQVCKLKCTRGGCCGKLLGTANLSRTAKEHFTEKGCKGFRQDKGQELLQQQQQATQIAGKHRLAFECAKKVAYIKGQ